jgi:acyl-CoA synthetase (AMP-forming)/AMP-acid ligase II
LLAGIKPSPVKTQLNEEDASDLIYTTGTTGNPKGCILVHGGKVACGRMIGVTFGFRRLWVGWDRCQNPFPFFTSSGISSMFMPWLYYGYTEILEQTFDVEKTLKTIEKEKSTVYLAAPSMYILIMDHPKFANYDLSSIKTFGYGGSLMPEELMVRINKKWPGIRLYHVYGLTEGGTGGLMCTAADAMRKSGAIGLPWGPDQEVKIVDENDMDLPPEEVGEIVLRGPNIMQAYYKDDKATEETLKNGWLHTGDLGRMDSEGFVYFVDRKKDMIVRGGFNVYAVEVENVLYEHPAVSQCAVIGKPHKVLGGDVMAMIVLRPRAKASAEELIAFCKDKLADFKRPRVIEFRESLPLNPMGKVDKKILRSSVKERVN